MRAWIRSIQVVRIDKLEAIDGFMLTMMKQLFVKLVIENKVAVVGQSGNYSLDKKIICPKGCYWYHQFNTINCLFNYE